jgi:transposase
LSTPFSLSATDFNVVRRSRFSRHRDRPSLRHRARSTFGKGATLYRARNRIERFFNQIKPFRRIATRYEKRAANFFAMLKLAATHLWLRRVT